MKSLCEVKLNYIYDLIARRDPKISDPILFSVVSKIELSVMNQSVNSAPSNDNKVARSSIAPVILDVRVYIEKDKREIFDYRPWQSPQDERVLLVVLVSRNSVAECPN